MADNENLIHKSMALQLQLTKIAEVAEKNKAMMNIISEHINAIEESLNKICLIFKNIELKTSDKYTLSLERIKTRKRLYCSINGTDIKRPIIELDCINRIAAFEELPLLLEEIYKNQKSIKNPDKDEEV